MVARIAVHESPVALRHVVRTVLARGVVAEGLLLWTVATRLVVLRVATMGVGAQLHVLALHSNNKNKSISRWVIMVCDGANAKTKKKVVSSRLTRSWRQQNTRTTGGGQTADQIAISTASTGWACSTFKYRTLDQSSALHLESRPSLVASIVAFEHIHH